MGEEADLDRLVEELIPELAARLDGSGVHEIEVAGAGWRIRVRRDRPVQMRRVDATPAGLVPIASGSNGSGPGGASYPHPRDAAHVGHPPARPTHAAPNRLVATAPAVGIFMPRGDIAAGSRVNAGDRLGVVDLLGVPQDVLAPADGILTASLVEAGEGVEYGQELLILEATS